MIEAGVARDWTWIAYGITNSQYRTGTEPEEEGRQLDLIIAEIASATGKSTRN